MLTKKYPSTTRIVGIVLRSYIPNSGECCDNESEKNNLNFPKAAEVFTPFRIFYVSRLLYL